jgi:hypothetical protein
VGVAAAGTAEETSMGDKGPGSKSKGKKQKKQKKAPAG